MRNGVVNDLVDTNLSMEEIASKWGVSFSMVRDTNQGKHQWVRDFMPEFPLRLGFKEKMAEARKMLREGLTDTEISEKLDLDIRRVINLKLRSLK